jgi:lysophospholipase L1-like esterase
MAWGRWGQTKAARAPGSGRMVTSSILRYQTRVINTHPTGYWPFAELSGTVISDFSGNGYNGEVANTLTLGADGIGDGQSAIMFTGDGYVNINAAGFPAAFGTTEGAIGLFGSLDPSLAYNDGVTRNLVYFAADANNAVIIRKEATGGLYFYYRAGGTIKGLLLKHLASKDTSFLHLWLDYSKTNDRVRVFVNGTPSAPITGLGNWVGVPASFLFGGLSAGSKWKGKAQHAVYYNTEQTPDLIWGLMHNPGGQLVFEGDSRTAGKEYPDRAYSEASAGTKRYGFGNWGVAGTSLVTMISTAAARIDPLRRTGKDICVVLGGVNDTDADAATIYSRIQTYCQARKAAGWTVIACTEIDAQDASRNAVDWHGTIYPALNTMLRNDHSFADALIDFGADARLQNALDTTYFNVDKVHPVSAGSVVMGDIAAPVIAPFL